MGRNSLDVWKDSLWVIDCAKGFLVNMWEGPCELVKVLACCSCLSNLPNLAGDSSEPCNWRVLCIWMWCFRFLWWVVIIQMDVGSVGLQCRGMWSEAMDKWCFTVVSGGFWVDSGLTGDFCGERGYVESVANNTILLPTAAYSSLYEYNTWNSWLWGCLDKAVLFHILWSRLEIVWITYGKKGV